MFSASSPYFLSSLSNIVPTSEGQASNMANPMKDVLREVLKLYGVSSDVAENIMGSGNQGQGRANMQAVFSV